MPHLTRFRTTIHAAARPQVVWRGIKVASVVTPILTLLNHGNEILAGTTGPSFWLQVGATFLVPFTVSVVSGAMALSATVAGLDREAARPTEASRQ
jgi:hypothetical protein